MTSNTDLDIDTDENRAIPHYVIESAMEHRGEDDNYAVVRSDNDWQFAETLPEANEIAEAMQSSADFVSPISETVQVIELVHADTDGNED
jgi:hypothetical protein